MSPFYICADNGRPFFSQCVMEQNKGAETDALIQQYNARLDKLAQKYNGFNDPSFAVVSNPTFKNVDIGTWPSNPNPPLVSGIDCFHPSVLTHRRMAVMTWNNLFKKRSARTTTVDPNTDPTVYCPATSDRIQIS
jgi:phospholipase B1